MLENSTKLHHVTLRVKNLEMMTKFYTETIGLTIREQEEKRVMLGTNMDIVELITDDEFILAERNFQGLYHLAIRVPKERDLGQLLFHFRDVNYSIDGAGDHGYSQALYMHDPEGNGIEIYNDRPISDWTIHEDGTIDAYTDPVNIENLIQGINPNDWNGLPSETDLGHVHLQISDITAARKFYLDGLGFDLKTDMGHAIFISKSGYHHDLGINQWLGIMPVLPKNRTGLDKVSFTVGSADVLRFSNEIESMMKKVNDNTYQITDPSSIVLEFIVK